MKVLVLSGTGDGRALARVLAGSGVEVVESVAGRTAEARQLPGVRVGGFGGVPGLVDWLRENPVAAVVDATHPFAARMTANAAAACAEVGVPLARLVRPSWGGRADAASWAWVDGHAGAVAWCRGFRQAGFRQARPAVGRVLLTVGRQELDAYRSLPDVVARVAEVPPGWVDPPGWELLVARGPYAFEGEVALLRDRGVGVLVTKDAGGDATAAKLDAAAHLGVPVVVVARPQGPRGVPEFPDSDGVRSWLAGVSRATTPG